MAVTFIVRQSCEQELSLTLDAPRLVIGRGKGCELRLMDPSISARHCSIRQEGGRNVIIDEGSCNGVMVSGQWLPAHTPHPVRDGDIIRVGRVWLELRFGTCIGSSVGSATRHTAAFAMDLLHRQLAEQGERVSTHLTVVAGPDAGKRIELDDPEREYVIGRARDADLMLSDELVSRRHVALAREGGAWAARDLGSKRGTVLGSGQLTSGGAPWRHTSELVVGDSVIRLIDPVAEAFAELARADDVRMRSKERSELPPAHVQPPEPAPAETDSEEPELPPDEPDEDEDEHAQLLALEELNDFGDALDELVQPTSRGYAAADVFVVLMALGLLSVSAAGLWWVLA